MISSFGASLAAGKDAYPRAEVRFEIEIGRFLKEGVERRGFQEAVELEMANAVMARRNFVRGGDDVEAALIKDDGIGLDLPLLRVLSRGLIDGQDDAPLVEQTTAHGHAVRAAYVYNAMADIAACSSGPSASIRTV